MAKTTRLSLADLQRYGPLWGTGCECRGLCPLCGDDQPCDEAHAALAVNLETGLWACHRCAAHGLLDEPKTAPGDDPSSSGSGRPPGRRWRRLGSRPAPAPGAPLPAQAAEQAEMRKSLRGLWSSAVSIDAPEAAPGVDYLWGRRGIPAWIAAEAGVRFSAGWYGRPVVGFPLRDELGRLVAAAGRYIDAAAPQTRSAGPKRAGVFVAAPGALEADGVCLCEAPITALSVAVAGRPAIALCDKHWPVWLVSRLAFKTVYISFDEGDPDSERAVKALTRELAMLGAKPGRLRTPPGLQGDWNDVLVAHGRQALREALRDASGRTGVWLAGPGDSSCSAALPGSCAAPACLPPPIWAFPSKRDDRRQ